MVMFVILGGLLFNVIEIFKSSRKDVSVDFGLILLRYSLLMFHSKYWSRLVIKKRVIFSNHIQ